MQTLQFLSKFCILFKDPEEQREIRGKVKKKRRKNRKREVPNERRGAQRLQVSLALGVRTPEADKYTKADR
jgi:hypothetical protein